MIEIVFVMKIKIFLDDFLKFLEVFLNGFKPDLQLFFENVFNDSANLFEILGGQHTFSILQKFDQII